MVLRHIHMHRWAFSLGVLIRALDPALFENNVYKSSRSVHFLKTGCGTGLTRMYT